ncbi:MAG TPA: EAL domain-containing protein [Solirubrobacteraceae bacterium]|jgi:EAL domain-containing protein (putative c-di-GMP-specific phosphodiesterase class I)|nr:EAL domain-containing protein [Solirubrobacteraceae bacterium]
MSQTTRAAGSGEGSIEQPAPPQAQPALSDVMMRRAIDPLQLVQRVADQALDAVAGADGALVGLLVDEHSLRYVSGSGSLSGWVGEPLELDGSLSGQSIRSGETLLAQDTETDARVNRTATRAYSVRSSLCVPLQRAGERLGVLNVSSNRPNAFDEHDVVLLSGLADFMSSVIGAASEFMASVARDDDVAGRFVANVLDPGRAEADERRAAFERLLATREFTLAFQPMFTLDGGRVFAVEALARFAGGKSDPPDVWLAQAHAAGVGVELEIALVEEALARLEELPDGALLSVNVGPEALCSPELAAALSRTDPGRVVVELTEHVQIENYHDLADVARGLRERGVRLAIDDAGAGFASLMHILKLAPDFIKLDRELTSGIDVDPVRRCLADSLVRFADETGAVIVAEGIETAGELATLRELGVFHGQGFHLARPAPIEGLTAACSAGSKTVAARAARPAQRHKRAERGSARKPVRPPVAG